MVEKIEIDKKNLERMIKSLKKLAEELGHILSVLEGAVEKAKETFGEEG